MATEQVDITPSPAILTVLGEIEFQPWQCVAELIDNSIDGFLSARLVDQEIKDPSVKVAFGNNTVVVKDNGPGMALDSLKNAVRAGWSSHERYGSLGLYGVGFNIATARLGYATTIWTTQAGSKEWVGLLLDLKELSQEGSYLLPVQRRQKVDTRISGTEIEITNLRSDWINNFSNAGWIRNNITKRLERIYSSMLRENNPLPVGFALYINDRRVSAWEYCVWPADWEVYRRDLNYVHPIKEIDVSFGEKYISRSTGKVYDSPDTLDPDDMITVPERVYGWLGIQRYTDETEYGIDILRNGRKIETACKDLFYWEDTSGNKILEYPIDNIRGTAGRIVGEIHLDHGYVHYTKHRFEREHKSWIHLLKAVRHNEPLTKRKDFGYDDQNNSPLGVLFRTFRRNSPYKDQPYWDVLVIKENDDAVRWAQEYRKRTPAYLDEDWWMEQIKKQDRPVEEPANQDDKENPSVDDKENPPNNENPQNNENVSDEDFILAGGSNTRNPTTNSGENDARDGQVDENPPPVKESRKRIAELGLPSLSGIGNSGRTYNVEVYSSKQLSGKAWASRLTGQGIFEIEIDFDHPIFQSTSFNYRDAILSDVAFMIASEEQSIGGNISGLSYAEILVELRRRFAASASLDANRLRMEIDGLKSEFARKLAASLDESAQSQLINQLPDTDTEQIQVNYARGDASESILKYTQMKHIVSLFEANPELYFQANCFRHDWTPKLLHSNDRLLKQHREKLVRDILLLLIPLGEYMSYSPNISDSDHTYRGYIRAALNHLREHMVE